MSYEYALHNVSFDELGLLFEAMSERRDIVQDRFGWVCHSIYNSLNLSHGGKAIPIENFITSKKSPKNEKPEIITDPKQVREELKKKGEFFANILNQEKDKKIHG